VHAQAQGRREVRDHIVVRLIARRHDQPIDASHTTEPLDLTLDHRRALQIAHDLARQSGGAHARLKDREDHRRRVSGSARRRR
jgi:hypothetical protein